MADIISTATKDELAIGLAQAQREIERLQDALIRMSARIQCGCLYSFGHREDCSQAHANRILRECGLIE